MIDVFWFMVLIEEPLDAPLLWRTFSQGHKEAR